MSLQYMFFLTHNASDILDQTVEIFFDSTPDDAVVNGIISVSKDISKGNYVSVVMNLGKQFGIISAYPVWRFSHDLKFAFDRATEQLVSAVVFKGDSGDELLDGACCMQEIVEVCKAHPSYSAFHSIPVS
jgi:hypothetical protein